MHGPILASFGIFSSKCYFRYKSLEELGDGTCGSVYKAINTETSEIVRKH